MCQHLCLLFSNISLYLKKKYLIEGINRLQNIQSIQNIHTGLQSKAYSVMILTMIQSTRVSCYCFCSFKYRLRACGLSSSRVRIGHLKRYMSVKETSFVFQARLSIYQSVYLVSGSTSLVNYQEGKRNYSKTQNFCVRSSPAYH